MKFKICGFTLSKKVKDNKEYVNYYVSCVYPIGTDKGIGQGVKQYVVPLITMQECISNYKLKGDVDLIGKYAEFFMNETYGNQSWQSVGNIRLYNE